MMSPKNFHIFYNIFFTYLCLFISATSFDYDCHTSFTFYTQNNISSTYKHNLNTLLSTLSTNARTNQNGFFNSTSSRRRDNPSSETAYGLFLCRGDVSTNVCKKCVDTATKEIVRLCPLEKEAVVFSDYCMLRYSDNNIFGIYNQYFIFSKSDNSRNVTEPERFYKILAYLMNELTTLVVNDDRKGKKFATQEANFTASQKVYALAQCTPDISSDTCKACLSQAISGLPTSCKKSKSCKVVLLNCFIWYEFFLFYNSKASAAPLVQNTPPPQIISENDHRRNWIFSARTIIAIAVPVISIVFIILIVGLSCFRRKAKGRKGKPKDINEVRSNTKSLHYEFGVIQDATNNFSIGNRIGQGGFGDVYKGKLPNGQEIAVKRLSQSSNQGSEEFKSEVVLVAKLQHRSLVRLLGFCLQGVERILIYEFVPNKSLDYYLFDRERKGPLNWEIRLKIIRRIARGLLYLLEDCPLKIVHRDLKPSNILLDVEMNPKISDFGMARIFGAHQTQGNTMRVVGTYGYMSPEYVMYGQYSIKSDVFSFGVLTLEIVSGNKNSSFCESNEANDLLSHAWKHWKEDTPLELIDSTLEDCYSRIEVLRCIQIGLLCVQKDAHKRPTMGSIVLMLSSNSITLPNPQRPAFFASSKTGIQPKEYTFHEYSSTSSMYIDEESVTKTFTKDV
ncbi:cysteine-rich receptor-like protein kinase 10 isoform X1 [Capsicum annuum]